MSHPVTTRCVYNISDIIFCLLLSLSLHFLLDLIYIWELVQTLKGLELLCFVSGYNVRGGATHFPWGKAWVAPFPKGTIFKQTNAQLSLQKCGSFAFHFSPLLFEHPKIPFRLQSWAHLPGNKFHGLQGYLLLSKLLRLCCWTIPEPGSTHRYYCTIAFTWPKPFE